MLGIAGAFVLGLLVGSFLNVVIYRLPVMLERDWRQQAREMLAGEVDTPVSSEPDPEPVFNLLTPRSRCPACRTPIRAWQNVPVLSWLLLRGKCAACDAPISARYPLIELLTGLLSALMVWHFGAGAAGAVALFFLWSLIALTVIDIDHQLLPDAVTYILLWAGLLLSATGQAYGLPLPDLTSSVIGAAAGYLILWGIYWLFKLATGKEGMGYGDFKLLAALGAWLGYQQLPVVILMSAAVGAIVGIGMIVVLGRDRQIPIPFGPYLAGAGLITFLWGESLVAAYLSYSGMN